MSDAPRQIEPLDLGYAEPTTRRTEIGTEHSVLAEIGHRLMWFFLGGCASFVLAYLPTVVGIPVGAMGLIFISAGPLALMAAIMLAHHLTLLRRRQAMAVVEHVGAAVRLGLPMPQLLRGAAKGERGHTAKQLDGVAESLAAGMTLGIALRSNCPHLDPQLTARLDAAERNGTLPAALNRIGDSPQDENVVGPQPRMVVAYGVTVLAFATVVTGMLMIFVMPKFEELMTDFDAETPGVTKALLAFSRFLSDSWLWLGLPALLLLLPWIIGQTLREIRSAQPRRALLRPMWRAIGWRLPLLGRAWKARQWATVLDATADGLELGRPVEESLIIAAAPGVAGPLRERVVRLAANLRAGQPWQEAARTAGLSRPMAQFLGSAATTGSLAVTCRFLARHFAAMHSRLTYLAGAILTPVVTLLLATVVGWIALSMFSPLIAIANAAMDWKVMP